MTAPDLPTDALASALPDGVRLLYGADVVDQLVTHQAAKLAEAGYVLVPTAPDEATIERLARVLHAIEPDSLDWDEDLSPDWRDRYRFDVRKLFADLADTSAQARHTADDTVLTSSDPLPANPDDLLTPEERKALDADLAQMARKRRDAEVKDAGEVLP